MNINSNSSSNKEIEFNEFNMYEITSSIIDVYEKQLKDWYEEASSNLLEFSDVDLEFIKKEYPNNNIDNIIKSLKTSNKFNLFEDFEFGNDRFDTDEEENEASDIYNDFANEVEYELNQLNFLSKEEVSFSSYEGGTFIMGSELRSELYGDSFMIQFYKGKIDFGVNYPEGFNFIKKNVDVNNYKSIAEIIVEYYSDFLYFAYKDNETNLLKFSKEDLDVLLIKHPELKGNLTNSVKAINKFKLFDYYSFLESKNNNL